MTMRRNTSCKEPIISSTRKEQLKQACGLLPILLVLGSQLFAQHKPQCIAYLTGDEIRVQCKGAERILLQKRGLSQYAVGAGAIATMTTKTVSQDHKTRLMGDNKVVLMRNEQETTVVTLPAGVRFLYSSCGTILANLRDSQDTTWDVITGKPVTFTNLRRPACSADRSRILGINSKGQLATATGTIIEQFRQFGSYAISPSGTVVAFLKELEGKVCVQPLPQASPKCYSSIPVNNGGVSVDDGGHVLFVQLTPETCYYRDGKLTVKRTTPKALSDQCFESALVTPEDPPRSVALLGYMPTWVSDAIYDRAQKPSGK